MPRNSPPVSETADPTHKSIVLTLKRLDTRLRPLSGDGEGFRRCSKFVPSYSRVHRAFRDTTLPLAEPVLGKNGEIVKDVTVPEGTEIVVAIRSANRNKAIWGEDAHVWRPERWLEPLPDGASGHM